MRRNYNVKIARQTLSARQTLQLSFLCLLYVRDAFKQFYFACCAQDLTQRSEHCPHRFCFIGRSYRFPIKQNFHCRQFLPGKHKLSFHSNKKDMKRAYIQCYVTFMSFKNHVMFIIGSLLFFMHEKRQLFYIIKLFNLKCQALFSILPARHLNQRLH